MGGVFFFAHGPCSILIVKLTERRTCMTCLLCGKEISTFSSHKTPDGRICKDCYKTIPSLLWKGSSYPSETTLRVAQKMALDNYENFFATSSYGDLHLDEMNSLFAIAKKLDKRGKPIDSFNIFSIYDLDDIGISCDKLSASDHNLYTSVEMTFEILKPHMRVKTQIKKRAKCKYKQVDSSHIEWTEPKELTFFRSILYQMLSGSFDRLKGLLAGKTLHDWDVEKARTVFMLDDDYSEQDLKKARRMLMKVYDPDVAEEDTSRDVTIINDMYDLLKMELEERK